ncbi:hypothetical protein QP166_14510 [Sphingomonas sp. LR60]|jgi:hypothetical protein|uniref:hypothetical protein n=1 Tax=Sphingomonas sp. LR60 TaxID=3050233 RepID=UPI002FE04071
MAVKFLEACQQGSLYNKGEIAGFDKETEKRLIEQKFAEPYKAPAGKTEPAA